MTTTSAMKPLQDNPNGDSLVSASADQARSESSR